MRKKLWQEVSEKLVAKITSGDWPVGSIIPGEIELAEQLSVSRDTVRKALDALVKAELVERRPHIGTRVKSKVQNGKFLHELSDIHAIDYYGNQFPRLIEATEDVLVTKELSEQLCLTENEPWVRFKNIRVADKNLNEPVVVTYVYVRKSMAYVAEEAKRHPRELIVSLIEGFLDIECAEVRQTFSAVVMSPDVAEHFNSKPGVPALKIVRCYLDREGNTITASESFHPAERFAFTVVNRKKHSFGFLS